MTISRSSNIGDGYLFMLFASMVGTVVFPQYHWVHVVAAVFFLSITLIASYAWYAGLKQSRYVSKTSREWRISHSGENMQILKNLNEAAVRFWSGISVMFILGIFAHMYFAAFGFAIIAIASRFQALSNVRTVLKVSVLDEPEKTDKV